MSDKWYTRHDLGEEAWCVIIKTIRSMQGGMRLGPMVLVGLGPGSQAKRDWHHGPCCWVGAQGPIGLGGPGTVQLFI